MYYYMVYCIFTFSGHHKRGWRKKSLEPPLESLETPIIYCYYDNKRLVFQSKTAAVIRVHHVYFWLTLPEVRMGFSHFWEFSERLQAHILVGRHWQGELCIIWDLKELLLEKCLAKMWSVVDVILCTAKQWYGPLTQDGGCKMLI